ncbi:MAG TPA: DUF4157 domain-containing protein [Pyrinomonadaceae bacterium]|nr:DUF4157 domain-containing protein [Pyrinomonadaceae bacterium]
MHTFAQNPKGTREAASGKSTKPGQSLSRQSRNAYSILQLQRTIGNQAVQRLLKPDAEELEAGAVSTPGDKHEQEADRVAVQVMRMPDSQVHRTTDLESSEPAAPGTTAASTSSGSGQALPDAVRSYFEPRFGHDFGDVRIHADANAAESARSIDARAYTLGNDIVFAQDEYKPDMPSGQHLLAHELTHVVQQSGNSAAPACIQRAVRVNNGGQRVNEAEYQAGGAKANVGSRFRVSALIADSVRRAFVDVAELEQYANGGTDNIGDVTTASAGVFWYRLPNNRVTVLGEQHQNPRGNVEDVILGVHTSRFMYEPFNEIAQVGGLSPEFSGTQSRLSQLNQQYRVSSLVNRRSFNPDLENIVIKALTGAQVFRNQFLPANPRTMGAAQQQTWGRRPSTSAYSFGERVALYLTTGIHIAQDLAQRPQGPPTAAEANLVQSGDALAAFYRTNQGVLDGVMRTKDGDDLIGIYELTAPGNFSVLPVLDAFSVLMHAYASQYIQRLGAQTGNAALTSEGQALERNPGATLSSLSPAREEIMWNRLQQAISGGYLIVGMGDAHRQNLTPRLNAAGIAHEEVTASLLRQRTAVNSSWSP